MAPVYITYGIRFSKMTQWTHDAQITPLRHQNDIATSFWRHSVVIIVPYACWELHWLDYMVGYQDRSPGTGRQAKHPIAYIIMIDHLNQIWAIAPGNTRRNWKIFFTSKRRFDFKIYVLITSCVSQDGVYGKH